LEIGPDRKVDAPRAVDCIGCHMCELRCPDFAIQVIECKSDEKETEADAKEGISKGEVGQIMQSYPERIMMQRQEPLAGAVNGFIYGARVPARRPVGDYTPRIVPHHEEAFIPLEDAHILWMR